MQPNGFNEALDQILAEDPRYDREAYLFLRDALDYTIKTKKKQKADISRHVSGAELLEGLRQYALKQFGPMVLTVFDYWGVRKCEDFGNVVFNLVRVGIFGKTETDSIEDFKCAYSFYDAFVKPFQPVRPVTGEVNASEPAQEIE